ncbi:MAG TPA: 16S rRNA (guanine(966)-N(2))-methyltransferase RsmD [Woeseiaceae bacterium]
MARRKTSVAGAEPPPGRVRIVAGKWRGRRLPVADVAGLRPTGERIRETLFNWLAPRIEGARCLDLYAGTGALGFEALSRGAGQVTFVERSPAAVAALRRAAALLGAEGARIHAGDARELLRRGGQGGLDLVFLDPPFDGDRLSELCRLLAEGQWLAPAAAVYLEQARDAPEAALPEGWRTIREQRAGNVRFTLVLAAGGAGTSAEDPR